MIMKKCPNCGQLNSDLATTCHSCHCNLDGATSSHNTSNHGTISNPNTTTSFYGNQTGNLNSPDTQNYNVPPNEYSGGQTSGTSGASTNKKNSNGVAGIAIVLLPFFILATIILGVMLSSAKDKQKKLEDNLNYYFSMAYEYKDKADFLDSYIVVSSDNKTYHTYDCSEWSSASFYAYNVDNAIGNGLKPCPYCIGN